MQLFFTRHGESQANIERIISNRDLPHALTARGRAQAAALAERLANRQIVTIYTSPILRAQETGQIVAARLQVPLLINAALREWDCGNMEGRGDEAAWAAHSKAVAAWAKGDWAHCIPGGESFIDMQARFVPFVQQLLTQDAHCDNAILLIGHGSLLYHMLPMVLANVDTAFIDARGMPNCVLIETTVRAGQLVCRAWEADQL